MAKPAHATVTIADAKPVQEAFQALEDEIEQLREWQQTPWAENCTGMEQMNRILVGLIRKYGSEGKLTLPTEVSAGVKLGQQVRWRCTGRSEDYIVIEEAEQCDPS